MLDNFSAGVIFFRISHEEKSGSVSRGSVSESRLDIYFFLDF